MELPKSNWKSRKVGAFVFGMGCLFGAALINRPDLYLYIVSLTLGYIAGNVTQDFSFKK